MLDLRKNDIRDEVFNRYKITYSLLNDTGDFMPDKDVNLFLRFVRKDMRKDLKRVKREYRRLRWQEWKERRHARKMSRKGLGKPEEDVPAEQTEREGTRENDAPPQE